MALLPMDIFMTCSSVGTCQGTPPYISQTNPLLRTFCSPAPPLRKQLPHDGCSSSFPIGFAILSTPNPFYSVINVVACGLCGNGPRLGGRLLQEQGRCHGCQVLVCCVWRRPRHIACQLVFLLSCHF